MKTRAERIASIAIILIVTAFLTFNGIMAKKAIEQGVALEITDEALELAIENHFWQPTYRRYKRTAF